MFKMQTKNGETKIINCQSGCEVKYDNLICALEYIGIMKLLYHKPKPRRAMEPYQVRTLCPGNYPIKIKI